MPRHHSMTVIWPDQRRIITRAARGPTDPSHRLVGKFGGELVGLTQYPATGPGPSDLVPAQRLDCPFMGRCRGCWVHTWPAGDELASE